MHTLKMSYARIRIQNRAKQIQADNTRILINHLIRVNSAVRLRPVEFRARNASDDAGRLLSIRGATGV